MKHPRIHIFGLLVECPFVQAKQNCPLGDYRYLNLNEKKQAAFERLDDQDVHRILKHHALCLENRS